MADYQAKKILLRQKPLLLLYSTAMLTSLESPLEHQRAVFILTILRISLRLTEFTSIKATNSRILFSPNRRSRQGRQSRGGAKLTSSQVHDVNPKITELKKRYDNKDCFEFVVGVLEDKGINYFGKGGVAGKLVEKARSNEKSPYTYFNGEGITDLLCDKPVNIHVPRVSEDSFEKVWSQLEPNLKEGAILSYSSQKFGHTGIVERSGNDWIYVNSSGTMGIPESYRVLDENLKAEINGWLRRAKRNNTFLDITLGVVNSNLAGNFSNSRLISGFSENISGQDVNLLA